MGNAEAQLRNAQAEINRQLEENEELKSRMICIDNLSGDESISFYTGFPNLQTFQATGILKPRERTKHPLLAFDQQKGPGTSLRWGQSEKQIWAKENSETRR